MDSGLVETETPAPAEHQDNAKRRQIMDGAREVFLGQGFDAASMGAIARKAGVSKGTLYVYFDSKEQLFEAIAQEACAAQAEGVFSFDPADHDVEAVLTRLGCSFVKFFCRPGAMSPLRTVISISERESGRLQDPDDRGLRGRGGPVFFWILATPRFSDRSFSMPAMHLPTSVSTTWSALRSARSWRHTGVPPDPRPRFCFRSTMSTGPRTRRLAVPQAKPYRKSPLAPNPRAPPTP